MWDEQEHSALSTLRFVNFMAPGISVCVASIQSLLSLMRPFPAGVSRQSLQLYLSCNFVSLVVLSYLCWYVMPCFPFMCDVNNYCVTNSTLCASWYVVLHFDSMKCSLLSHTILSMLVGRVCYLLCHAFFLSCHCNSQ